MCLKHPFCSILSLIWTLGLMLFLYITNAQAGQAMLAWEANTEPTLGGYQLYYGQASGNYTANVDVGKQTSYTLTGLTDGKTYYFAAKAYNTGKTVWSGFSNQVSKTISSTTAPVAGFSTSPNPASGTAPLTVTFTDTSTGTINTNGWSWKFCSSNGTCTTDTAKTVVKTYNTPDTYTASLTVTGPGGSNTASKTISVAAPGAAPVANFSASPTSGTAPLAVTFTNSSTNATSYSWDFNGDGATDSTAQNPSYTYTTVGTYTVSLTAKGSGGANTKTRSGYIAISSGGGGGGSGGLVAAYNFEEAGGTTVVDASGKGNHGTISGAVRTTSGKYGKALFFDGVNDWVTIKDTSSLDLTSGMTLEAWVYPTVSMTQWATVVLKEQPGGGLYELYANGDQSQPLTSVTIGGDYKVLSGGPWLIPNTWVHLAATYNGATQRLYVNGSEVDSRPQSGSIQVSDSALRIGGNSIWGEFFKGRIDEVRVYNRALSAGEIQTDMNKSVATSSPPSRLVGTDTIGPVTDSNPQGKAQAFQTQATVTGLMTSFSVYLDKSSTATKLVAGIYADNNGHPDTLLAQGTLTSPGAGGWKKISLPATSLTAGKAYWIAILSPSGVLQFRDAVSSVNQRSETSAQSTLTTLPSTWTTGTVYYDGQLSAYGAGY
jgi:PKD repeat protein